MAGLTQPRAWWRATALALALLAAGLPWAMRALVGPPGAMVHVRWQPSLDAAARQSLEARFRLADAERLEEGTWRYDLVDPSNDNIRALVGHPAVADTHYIDRPQYSLEPSTIRTDRRQRFSTGGGAVVAGADRLAILLAALAGLLLALGTSGRAHTPQAVRLLLVQKILTLWNAGRTAAAPALRWLSRGIPELDARTLGVFRIVFGVAVLMFFAFRRVDSARLSAIFDPQIESGLHAAVFQWLRGRPAIADLLTPWLLTLGVAFTAGLFTRLTYGLFVAGAIVWAFAAVSFDNTHPYSPLILTLVALLPSRWGEAWSLDAWLRRVRGREIGVRAAGKPYGYSVWVPGLVFGVAFAAAAWAKLGPNGISWILNGSVKYHFITDSVNAPVDWGLQLAAHPLLAILASLGAVAIEALVITAAFSRSELYRVSMGIGALALLAGFRLFMGVFWPGWWILLLGFLPWQRLSRLSPVRLKPDTTYEPARLAKLTPDTTYEPARGAAALPTAAQLAAIVFVIAQQILISALAIERAPMFTHYPMYATTYAGQAAFDASMPPFYRIVVTTDRGNVDLSCNASEELVAEFRAALHGSQEGAATVWRAVRGCRPDLAGARQVTFEEDRRVFDWDRLTFTTTRGVAVIGPLPHSPG